MAKIELIATAAFGLEAVVAYELKQLGYNNLKVENGRVTFVANEYAICHTNLWLRTADRVLLKMGEFKATTFEELFQQTKALPWPDWLPEDAHFPVTGKSIKSTLHSVPDCQAIVKKAVVEKMKEVYQREWFKETGPTYKIEVALLKDIATLTIDTSGAGLHKRGYRKLTAKAPLRETLAAAMILLSYWQPDRLLIDPFCGSGTIPIEAALIGQNIAPGLTRNFVSEDWPAIPKKYWQEVRRNAHQAARYDQPLNILGYDIDKEVLSMARYHAREAGVDEFIDFHPQDIADFSTKKNTAVLLPTLLTVSASVNAVQWKNYTKQWGRYLSRWILGLFMCLLHIRVLKNTMAKKPIKKESYTTGALNVTIIIIWGHRRLVITINRNTYKGVV